MHPELNCVSALTLAPPALFAVGDVATAPSMTVTYSSVRHSATSPPRRLPPAGMKSPTSPQTDQDRRRTPSPKAASRLMKMIPSSVNAICNLANVAA